MISEAQARAVALFYHYFLVDEALAEELSINSVYQLKKQFEDKEPSSEDFSIALVRLTYKNMNHLQLKKKPRIPASGNRGHWQLPPGISLSSWKAFKKEGGAEELATLVWSKILTIPDDCIAKGLGVSAGTVRHRLGRGLRQLGSHLSSSPAMGV